MSGGNAVKMDTDPFNEEEELKQSLEKLILPTKAEHELEQSTGFGQEASCFINTFKLDLSGAPSTIYQYELKFMITKSTGEELSLHDAMAHLPEAARSRKRKALICLTRLMHEEYKDVFRKQQMGHGNDDIYWRHCCAFDCGSFYYTGVKIDDNVGELPEEQWRAAQEILDYAKGARGPIKWSLTYVNSIPIQGEYKKSPEALMFFTTLAQQVAIRSEKIDMKPDAAYLVDGEPTKENKELRKGICMAAKVMGDDVVVQMDSKISLFFQAMPLMDFIKKSAAPGADLRRFLFDKVASRKLNKELKNLPLRVRHLKYGRTFECKGFSEADANGTKFAMKDRDEPISVADYYLEVYKYRLRNPNLPLVRERRGKGGDSFYPIEVLDIPEGIRVSNQKMTREAQENMISKSCRAPAQLGRDLEMSRCVAGLDGTSKYIKAFGIKLSRDFNMIDGRILWKPHIAGMAGIHPDINERGQISYIKGGFKFADPAKPSRPIILVALANAIGGRECDILKEELRRVATDFGMKIDFANIRDPCLFGGSIEQLREFMNVEKRNTSMFFFVTKEKMDESHNMVKKIEQEIGVVTQCISQRTANDCLSKKRVTQFNVIAKMNQKLGGVVANPEAPPDLKNSNPDAYARSADWFKDRMFVGFTLSHAGAQSFADRVVGEEVREPTCVGMGFTLKQPGKRSAMSWFQKKRYAMIMDIKRHMVRALDIYAESNGGRHPSAILIFRKGMSEGELKKAAKEMDDVMEAIKEIGSRPKMESWRPTVQCLVCMANTPDRMFYNRGDANVPAGTCLVDGATHPNRVEFLIVPHNAIKGTAKGVRCTLVADKKGRQGRQLEVAELQMLYHTMCYLNGVAASPTRLPVPLADSEKVAERQMNIFKESIRNGDDTMSMASGRSTGGVINDGSENFFEKLSDNFDHKFKDTQYYA